MVHTVLTQEVVGNDFAELAESFDLGTRSLPWHFDYFDEDEDVDPES
jgi:hypothetical protein